MSSEAHEAGPDAEELESKVHDQSPSDADSDSDGDGGTDGVVTNESGVMAVQSLCMSCHGTAQTRIYPTKIPFFQEIIVMSSHCKACGFRSNEIRPAGEIKPMGARLTLTVTTPEVRNAGPARQQLVIRSLVPSIAILSAAQDLNRQVVRTDSASFQVPELGFEIPANTQVRGEAQGGRNWSALA